MITKSEYKILKRFSDVSEKDTFLNELPNEQVGRVRNLCKLGYIELLPRDHDEAFIGSLLPEEVFQRDVGEELVFDGADFFQPERRPSGHFVVEGAIGDAEGTGYFRLSHATGSYRSSQCRKLAFHLLTSELHLIAVVCVLYCIKVWLSIGI